MSYGTYYEQNLTAEQAQKELTAVLAAQKTTEPAETVARVLELARVITGAYDVFFSLGEDVNFSKQEFGTYPVSHAVRQTTVSGTGINEAIKAGYKAESTVTLKLFKRNTDQSIVEAGLTLNIPAATLNIAQSIGTMLSFSSAHDAKPEVAGQLVTAGA